jgi:hypothetical protein
MVAKRWGGDHVPPGSGGIGSVQLLLSRPRVVFGFCRLPCIDRREATMGRHYGWAYPMSITKLSSCRKCGVPSRP